MSPTFEFNSLENHHEVDPHFLSAHRTKDFDLYIEVLEELTQLLVFFHGPSFTPSGFLLASLTWRLWVLEKSSSISLGQWPMNSLMLKGLGRAVGLTDNPAWLRHWLVAGPDQACLLNAFEKQLIANSEETQGLHHERYASVLQRM